jgi:branched-chain amino acid aminotransferase
VANEEKRVVQVWMNGKIVPESKAKVSIYDRSYLYGDAVFSALPVRDGVPYRMDDHIDRTFSAMHYLFIQSPVTQGGMKEALVKTVIANKMDDGYIRLQVSRGTGMSVAGWRPEQLDKPASLVVFPGPNLKQWLERTFGKGKAGESRTAVITMTRKPPSDALPPGVKDVNYINNILSCIEAQTAGADLGFMLDYQGNIADGVAYNIYCVKDGVIYTPTLKACLKGISRISVIDIAARLGIKLVETDFDPYFLCTSEEFFTSSTAMNIQPVVKVNARLIGDGKPGKITLKLRAAIEEDMRTHAAKFKKSPEWAPYYKEL